MIDLKCPKCKEDLRENLMFIQDGCENRIFYKLGKDGEWYVDDETDGHNVTDDYYVCRLCDEVLPKEYQEYFNEIIGG